MRFRQGAGLDEAVFPSRRGGGHLHATSIERVVWKAAERAGLEGKVATLAAAMPRDARA
jgi:hypothetical protein